MSIAQPSHSHASSKDGNIEPEVLRPEARGGVVLLCDHASNHIPPSYDGLGLGAEALCDHIAWDIGAAAVTRRISELMDVPAVLGSVSRLLVDANRDVRDASLIPAESDGVEVPGNRGLSAEETAARIDRYYTPFHDAAAAVVDGYLADGGVPLVMGMHSFTAHMGGKARPWHVGFLWDRDPRLAQALIGLLERETDLTIGDNQPYSGQDLYYSMYRHGAAHGLPQTTLEIRQDLLQEPAHIEEWAVLFANLLDECLSRTDLVAVQHFT